MNVSLDYSRRELRLAVYWLLILTSLGAIVGRVWSLKSNLGQTPLLSANDRSRWCTVRALVDHGTFAIDDVIFTDVARQRRDREWYTIDMVRHRGPDGVEHFYSSKPPLLATLLAGGYWLLRSTAGFTLAEHPFDTVRCLVLLFQVLPLAGYFVLLARLIERYGTTDWGRIFVMVVATHATFVTAFAVTINNHLPAAIGALVAIASAVAIWWEGRRELRYFAVAGFFAAFTAANELPALSLFAAIGAALCYCSPRQTVIAFVPAAAVVAAAFFGTNYAAHGSLRPPYAHRGDGPILSVVMDRIGDQLARGEVPSIVRFSLSSVGIELSAQATVSPAEGSGRWSLWDPASQRRVALVERDGRFELRRWDNWYEYEGSYWIGGRATGVDRGEPSRAVYALHVLIGHHGVFSLTPVWLLSLVGAGCWLWRPPELPPSDARFLSRACGGLRGLAVLIVAVTGVCLLFYLSRPLADRNYGGVSIGFRWLFWMTPLWLLSMLPAADWLGQRRGGWIVGGGLLLVSVASVSYSPLNPWSHPWLYRYWQYLGWLE